MSAMFRPKCGRGEHVAPPTAPECEKIVACADESLIVSQFMDWLVEEHGVELPRMSPEALLAAYFDIDLDKVEAERRAILDFVRKDQP